MWVTISEYFYILHTRIIIASEKRLDILTVQLRKIQKKNCGAKSASLMIQNNPNTHVKQNKINDTPSINARLLCDELMKKQMCV